MWGDSGQEVVSSNPSIDIWLKTYHIRNEFLNDLISNIGRCFKSFSNWFCICFVGGFQVASHFSVRRCVKQEDLSVQAFTSEILDDPETIKVSQT